MGNFQETLLMKALLQKVLLECQCYEYCQGILSGNNEDVANVTGTRHS